MMHESIDPKNHTRALINLKRMQGALNIEVRALLCRQRAPAGNELGTVISIDTVRSDQ